MFFMGRNHNLKMGKFGDNVGDGWRGRDGKKNKNV